MGKKGGLTKGGVRIFERGRRDDTEGDGGGREVLSNLRRIGKDRHDLPLYVGKGKSVYYEAKEVPRRKGRGCA